MPTQASLCDRQQDELRELDRQRRRLKKTRRLRLTPAGNPAGTAGDQNKPEQREAGSRGKRPRAAIA